MATTNQTIPIHVAIIFDDHVRLEGDVKHLWQQMRDAGYADRLFIDEHGYAAVKFDEGNPHNKNISLLTLLFLLNDLGVSFAEDYTQLLSPAAFMRELESKLVLRKAFRSIIASPETAEGWTYALREPAT